jgi:hypothetical protein
MQKKKVCVLLGCQLCTCTAAAAAAAAAATAAAAASQVKKSTTAEEVNALLKVGGGQGQLRVCSW